MLAETPEAIAAGQFTIPTIWAAGSVAGGAVRGGRARRAAGRRRHRRRGPRRGRWPPHPVDRAQHRAARAARRADRAAPSTWPARACEREEQVLLERERLHERERIARVVHDGVLQSLAYIHRRGDEIGGRGGRAVGHRRRAGALAAPLRLRHRARPTPTSPTCAASRAPRSTCGCCSPRTSGPTSRSRCPPTRSWSTGSSRSRSTPPSPPRSTTSHGTPGRARTAWVLLEGDSARHRAHHPRRRRRRRARRPARRRRPRPDGRQRLDPRPGRGPRRHRRPGRPARRGLRGADDGAAHRRGRAARPTGTRRPDRRRPRRPRSPDDRRRPHGARRRRPPAVAVARSSATSPATGWTSSRRPSDGPATVRRAQATRPDVLVLDLNLPGHARRRGVPRPSATCPPGCSSSRRAGSSTTCWRRSRPGPPATW